MKLRDLEKIITEEIADALKDISLLNESSLSRVYSHIQEHDCAVISAQRSNPKDRTKCAEASTTNDGKSPEEMNRKNARDLKAALLSSGYGVTVVDGSYIEDFETPQAVEVSEKSFFVVNLKDSDGFLADISSLGEKFCQDSVLIIPKGGTDAFLLGTNNSEFPGYGDRVSVGGLKMGKEAEFMTRVKKRPFIFKEKLEEYSSLSRTERMAVKAIVKK